MSEIPGDYICPCGLELTYEITHQAYNMISITLLCKCGKKSHHREGWVTPEDVAIVAYEKLWSQANE